MKKEIYLKDKQFLKELDNEKIKTLIGRITILSWDEQPLADFTGKILPGGTVNLDGNSSMRRTCNISLLLDEDEMNITKIDNLIALNKKVKVEIGVYNTLNKYTEYDIIWFPLGIYVIIQPNISNSTSGTTVSLQLKDKMCLLNGEIAGTLPASVTFNEMSYTDNDGNEYIENPTIFQIILELVNHFGGEQLGNIIISDLDTRIKKVMKWNSEKYPVYFSEQSGGNNYSSTYLSEATIQRSGYNVQDFTPIHYGEDLGFVYTDFIWPESELIGDIGSSICDILDKISNLLGNFEYFYDVYGIFHFQEKKNYLNTTQATTFLRQLKEREDNNYLSSIEKDDYLINLANGKSEYKFDNNNLITSFTNVPQFNLIKNDFLVWGLRKTADETTLPIRYHLAIDKKPQIGQSHLVVIYKDEFDYYRAAKVTVIDSINDTEGCQLGQFYCVTKSTRVEITDQYEQERLVYGGNYGIMYVDLIGINAVLYKYDWEIDKLNPENKEKKLIPVSQLEDVIYLAYITPSDWRTELYLQGVEAQPFALNSGYYFAELVNEWPKIYDIVNNKFRDGVLRDPTCMDYFLDFIEPESAIGGFCIDNIGRRSYAITDDKINCIFSVDPKDYIIIQSENNPNYTEEKREAENRGQKYTTVNEDVFQNLIQGGNHYSAYAKVRELLYQYTSYCENISLQTIPIYHLDVNTRITVQDQKSNISGDYLINRITLPLDCTGTMNISATRALERI